MSSSLADSALTLLCSPRPRTLASHSFSLLRFSGESCLYRKKGLRWLVTWGVEASPLIPNITSCHRVRILYDSAVSSGSACTSP